MPKLTPEEQMYVGETFAAGANYQDIMKFFKPEPRKDDGREMDSQSDKKAGSTSQRTGCSSR